MSHRTFIGAIVLATAFSIVATAASAFDESKYPAFQGQWKRKPGTSVNSWDESKNGGLAQEPPLTPEYRKLWESSMADQAAGGQGLDMRYTCISNGMPRMATIVRQLEFFIHPEITLIVFENNLPRRIYTDGRGFNATDNVPSYNGYSIGKWIDTDGDGKFDVLDVETRNFKGARLYDQTGIPLHHDNQSIIHERMYIDKSNPDTLVNEITVTDNALTRPWKVVKNYRREKNAEWYEDLCSENNNHVVIGKENYFMSADGYLMPAKKDQQPPDLRYFKKAGN
jgi:hypothetical protein